MDRGGSQKEELMIVRILVMKKMIGMRPILSKAKRRDRRLWQLNRTMHLQTRSEAENWKPEGVCKLPTERFLKLRRLNWPQ